MGPGFESPRRLTSLPIPPLEKSQDGQRLGFPVQGVGLVVRDMLDSIGNFLREYLFDERMNLIVLALRSLS